MAQQKKASGKGRKTRDVRLVDVAKAAEVSRATAARALGGYGFVSDAAYEKVRRAAESLNYRVNDLARSMRLGHTRTIGVVAADITNSFFSASIRAMADVAARENFQILVLNTDDNPERESAALRLLLQKRVDGMIVAPSARCNLPHFQTQDQFPVPIVLFDRCLDDVPLASVTTDDFAAARDAVRHFLTRGHRRIGILVAAAAGDGHSDAEPPGMISTGKRRLEGWRCALLEAGITPAPGWVRYSRVDFDVASQAARGLLSQRNAPSAVLAANEEMAVACIAACSEIDLKIGRDVSLILFDDTPWARVFNPSLSVVRRPVRALGQQAVALLLRKINGETEGETINLTTEFVERDSVAFV